MPHVDPEIPSEASDWLRGLIQPIARCGHPRVVRYKLVVDGESFVQGPRESAERCPLCAIRAVLSGEIALRRPSATNAQAGFPAFRPVWLRPA